MFDPIMLCGNLIPNSKQQYHPQGIRVHSWEKVKKDCEISCNSLNSRSRRCSWACTIWKSLIFINFHALKTSESELPNMAEMVPSAARLTFLACFTRAALVDETHELEPPKPPGTDFTAPEQTLPNHGFEGFSGLGGKKKLIKSVAKGTQAWKCGVTKAVVFLVMESESCNADIAKAVLASRFPSSWARR